MLFGWLRTFGQTYSSDCSCDIYSMRISYVWRFLFGQTLGFRKTVLCYKCMSVPAKMTANYYVHKISLHFRRKLLHLSLCMSYMGLPIQLENRLQTCRKNPLWNIPKHVENVPNIYPHISKKYKDVATSTKYQAAAAPACRDRRLGAGPGGLAPPPLDMCILVYLRISLVYLDIFGYSLGIFLVHF